MKNLRLVNPVAQSTRLTITFSPGHSDRFLGSLLGRSVRKRRWRCVTTVRSVGSTDWKDKLGGRCREP